MNKREQWRRDRMSFSRAWDRRRGVATDAMLACSSPLMVAAVSEADPPAGQGRDFRQLTLIGDGVTEMADGSRIVLDKAAATDVIAEMRLRGVDIPIDLDHATLHAVRDHKPALAVGWIDHKSVRYVPGVGLVASIRWNDDGLAYLHSKAYRYMSPVVMFDKQSGRVRRLHSLALTNTPLTLNAPALKAASEALLKADRQSLADTLLPG